MGKGVAPIFTSMAIRHNVVGSDDLRGLAVAVYARVLSLLNIPHHMCSYREVLDGMFRLLRVDTY